ncbi:hypothetical protein [Streptomyces sp. NPDC002580]|uniref:hypothetical protein n=1 Tax=Streptomyces sp. NPDC002580 TaxID=3364653 RepID=UPI00369494C6
MTEPTPCAKPPGRITDLRLLPWPSPDGKPCYLSSGGAHGWVTRLADTVEERQLATGAEVLVLAREVLDDPMAPYTEVRYAAIRVAECLGDALRVAESRGLRVPAPDTGGDGADRTGGAGSPAPEPGR